MINRPLQVASLLSRKKGRREASQSETDWLPENFVFPSSQAGRPADRTSRSANTRLRGRQNSKCPFALPAREIGLVLFSAPNALNFVLGFLFLYGPLNENPAAAGKGKYLAMIALTTPFCGADRAPALSTSFPLAGFNG